MIYRLLADLSVVMHFAFIVFVALGGLLVLRWRWSVWLHLPAAVWGAAVELFGWYCPLTGVENWLRRAAGDAGYSAGFVEQYLLPILYPARLTPGIQLALGVLLVAVNVIIYVLVWRRRGHRRRRREMAG